MFLISQHDLDHLEESKEALKQRVCLEIDDIFSSFVENLKSRSVNVKNGDLSIDLKNLPLPNHNALNGELNSSNYSKLAEDVLLSEAKSKAKPETSKKPNAFKALQQNESSHSSKESSPTKAKSKTQSVKLDLLSQKPKTELNDSDVDKLVKDVKAEKKSAPLKDTESNIYKTLSLDCPVAGCGVVCENKQKLSWHLKHAHSLRHYLCPFRGCVLVSFDDKDQLRKHFIDMHHDKSKWHCHMCDFAFNNPMTLPYHMLEYHYSGQFKCAKDGCSLISRTRHQAILHNEHEHFEKFSVLYLKCLYDDCDTRCKDKNLLSDHMKTVHGKMKLACLLCGDPFQDSFQLSSHSQTAHKGETMWPCAKCGQSFDGFLALERHKYIVHYEGLFLCNHPDCHFTGFTRAIMLNHFHEKHSTVLGLKQMSATR